MTATIPCAVCGREEYGCQHRNGEHVCYAPVRTDPPGFRFVRENLGGGRFYVPVGNENPAPIDEEPAGIEFPPEWAPVCMSELRGGDDVPWVWHGYVARGFATLLVGMYKAGKSTLLSHLLRAMDDGGDLAGTVAPGRALVVSEEGAALWARRRDDLGVGDHVDIICRPFKTKPSWGAWERFVEHVGDLVRQRDYALVVFDTLAALLPVKSENEATEVLRAMLPLHRITEAGAGLLLIHHPRKSDGGEGTASRGSGALLGWVDIIFELRRFAPSDRDDRRRTLVGWSRFDETPDELVVELTDEGYQTVGTKGDAKHGDRAKVLRELLPTEPPGLTVNEARDAWPEGGIPKPGVRTFRADLAGLEGVSVTGAGTRGDPKRFYGPANSIPASSVP